MNGLTGEPAWSAPLQALGLRAVANAADLRNGKISFRAHDGWGVFEAAGPRGRDPLRGQLDRAGLWKVTGSTRGPLRRVCELPPQILSLAESAPGRFEDVSRWTLATMSGKADASWSPPTREEIEELLPEHALTMQTGAIVRQGTLSLDRRLTFGFPIVPELPQDLPRARKAWLLQLLADGQSRWRMVRIGLTRSRGVQAQVDFTGVPREVLEQLLPIGVDALRHVVRSLVEPADFLVNGAAACRAVEVRPKPKRRRKP